METEDVVHVLRNVHRGLGERGLVLEIHPLGHDFPVRAGGRGLGFVDARAFSRIVDAMDAVVERTIAEGLFEDVRTARRYVAERFDDAAEALEHVAGWENLRLPAPVRRRLSRTDERPVEFVETIGYRLLRKAPDSGRRSR